MFANHSAEYELVDLLRMTAERLSQFENQDREKQVGDLLTGETNYVMIFPQKSHISILLYFRPVP